MRKIAVPFVAYVSLAVTYLVFSGAPLRVHVFSLVLFAAAFLTPALWAATIPHWRGRLIVSGLCAVVGIIVWDATAHFVIVKAEPFLVLRTVPLAYPLGGTMFMLLTLGVAYAASPPNTALNPDAQTARAG